MMQSILTIVVLTSIYAILAGGIVVLYRGTRVLNLAHGELAILLGYLFATAGMQVTGSILGGMAVVMVFSAIFGAGIYWLLMRHLIAQPFYVAILATIGIAILAKASIVLLWGGRAVNIELGANTVLYPYSTGGWFSYLDAITIATAVIFFILLYYALTSTRLGIQFRAVAENPLLASQRGVNVNTIMMVAWVVALFAASIAGVLYGSRSVLSLQAVVIGIGGLTAALVGGLDSLRGAIAGALLVATVEYATVRLIDPILSQAIPFVLLLTVMMWRPWGIFGTREEIQRV